MEGEWRRTVDAGDTGYPVLHYFSTLWPSVPRQTGESLRSRRDLRRFSRVHTHVRARIICVCRVHGLFADGCTRRTHVTYTGMLVPYSVHGCVPGLCSPNLRGISRRDLSALLPGTDAKLPGCLERACRAAATTWRFPRDREREISSCARVLSSAIRIYYCLEDMQFLGLA